MRTFFFFVRPWLKNLHCADAGTSTGTTSRFEEVVSMRTFFFYLGVIFFFLLLVVGGWGLWKFGPLFLGRKPASLEFSASPSAMVLPAPDRQGSVPLERTLQARRSVRDFEDVPLPLGQIGQILWAAQGITLPEKGFRTAPSAFSLYPLKVYLAAERVEGLTPGFYGYDPEKHALIALAEGDVRAILIRAVRQPAVSTAPAALLLTADEDAARKRLGDAAAFCVAAEAGHAAQNVYLQATALGLGTVSMGGIDGGALREVFALPEKESPLYVMPLGVPKER